MGTTPPRRRIPPVRPAPRRRRPPAVTPSDWRALAENNPTGMLIVSPTGEVVFANAALAELLDQSLEALLGQPSPFNKRSSNVSVQRADGHTLSLELHYSAIRWGGRPAQVIMVHDRTAQRAAQAKQRETEARFREVAVNSPDTVYVFDAATQRVTYSNHNTFLDYGPDDLRRPNSIVEAVHAADRAGLRAAWEAAGRGEAARVEYRVRRRDGEWEWVVNRLTPMQDTDGWTRQVLSTVTVITERKRVDAALRQSEEQFRRLTDHMLDMVSQVNGGLAFEYASPSHATILGWQPEQLIGRLALEFVHPDDLQGLMEVYSEAVNAGLDSARFEYRYQHAAGHYVWLESTASPLRDEAGEFAGAILSSRDITERKAAQTELQQREHYFRTLLENISDMITLVDTDGRVQYVGPSVTNLLGYTPEELIGQSAIQWVHPDDAGYAIEQLQARTNNLGPQPPARMRIRHRDGSWRHVTVISSPLITIDGMQALVTATRDVTEEHRLRQQAEGLAAENMLLLKDQSAALAREQRLNAIAQMLTTTLDLPTLLKELNRLTAEAIGAEISLLGMLDESGAHLNTAHVIGAEANLIGPRIGRDERVAWAAVEAGCGILIADHAGHPRARPVAANNGLGSLLAVPIMIGDRCLGVLQLGRRASHDPFTERDLAITEAIGRQAAIAIENARLFREAQAQAQELATLYRATARLHETTDLGRLAEEIVSVVVDEFAQTHCALLLLDDAQHMLLPVAQKASAGKAFVSNPVPADGPGLIPAATRSGAPVYAPDVRGDARYLPGFSGTRSELAIPLHFGQRVGGVLNLESETLDAFSDRDRRVLGLFAERAALALQTAQLFAEVRQIAYDLSALNDIAQTALEKADTASILHVLADQLEAISQSDGATITLWNEDDNRVKRGGASQSVRDLYLAGPLPAADEPTITGLIMEQRRTVLCADVRAEDSALAQPLGRIARVAFIGVPLIVRGQVLGAAIALYAQPHVFQPEEVARIERAATQIALAVANALLLQRLEKARAVAEESNRLKSEFLANTSHELRTPLTGILGSLKLVLDEECDSRDEEASFIRAAYEASRRLLDSINDLLDFSRIEAGKMSADLQATDLVPLLLEVYQLTRAQAEQKHVELRLLWPPTGVPLVQADRGKTQQILLNLIGNALKFTERGSVEVELAPHVDKGHLAIEVRDTGIGVPLAAQGKLFQPFVQADGSTTRRYGGTGLGLSISRRLAELMGGTLTLSSEGEGQGSTFMLTLPLAE